MTTVEQIADAILYEGYILYPYRASALKNGQRWNFGVLYPPAYAAAQRGSDASTMQCQCLARIAPGKEAKLRVTVRFLHLVTRDSWQEAIAREIEIDAPGTHSFVFPPGEDRDAAGIVRRREKVEGLIEVAVQPVQHGWSRVSVRISNCGACHVPREDSAAWPARESALRRSLVSTHAILRAPGGEFASLLDPPQELRELSAECSNVGLWPVLAGDATPPDTILASPIILYDRPQIAPQSAGALFDGTEIDEILSLRILTLTDEEKREMRETDPKTRGLLERTEALDAEQWMALHGVMRDAGGSGVANE
jgi:hydrogenase maturation protease